MVWFFRKLRKMSQKLSSAAVVIGALRINILLLLKIVFILANSSDPDEMLLKKAALSGISSGSSLFAKVPVYGYQAFLLVWLDSICTWVAVNNFSDVSVRVFLGWANKVSCSRKKHRDSAPGESPTSYTSILSLTLYQLNRSPDGIQHEKGYKIHTHYHNSNLIWRTVSRWVDEVIPSDHPRRIASRVIQWYGLIHETRYCTLDQVTIMIIGLIYAFFLTFFLILKPVLVFNPEKLRESLP